MPMVKVLLEPEQPSSSPPHRGRASKIAALVHVRADDVESPRIAGNGTTFVACGLSVSVVQFSRASKIVSRLCGITAGVVLGLNLGSVVAAGLLLLVVFFTLNALSAPK
ncbi:MAG: hypothetical protein KTU85_11880 [Acidimicrobiia bacterium]|nr:hypothetical protein [Acidimicrobiia bacterium]